MGEITVIKRYENPNLRNVMKIERKKSLGLGKAQERVHLKNKGISVVGMKKPDRCPFCMTPNHVVDDEREGHFYRCTICGYRW